MPIFESKNFVITQCRRTPVAGNNIAGPRQFQRGHAFYLEAACKPCRGETFEAHAATEPKPSAFKTSTSGLTLTCSSGTHNETIPTVELYEVFE